MSGEDRQRIIRRAGSDPAEAERQTRAHDSREAFTQEQAQERAEDPGHPVQERPLAEDPAGPPRPRR